MTQSDKYDLSAPILAPVLGCNSCRKSKHYRRNPNGSHRTPVRPTSVRGAKWRSIIVALVFLFAGRPSKAQNVSPEDLEGFEGVPPIVSPVSAQQVPRLTISSPTIPSPILNTLDSDCAVERQYRAGSSSDRQKDWDWGHKLAVQIASEETIVEDPVVTGYLNRLEKQLVHDSGLKGCFVVGLIVDKEVNAYSLPGGFLYLTTGLAIKAEREGELVAALAHETAHVTARHFSRIERKRKFGHNLMLAGGPAGYLVAQLFGPLFMSKQMRNAEFEADRLCLQYQHASGYDLGELTSLLRNIVQQDKDSGSSFTRLFNTHPPIDARLRRLQTLGSRLPAIHRTSKADAEEFRRFKEYLLSQVTGR